MTMLVLFLMPCAINSTGISYPTYSGFSLWFMKSTLSKNKKQHNSRVQSAKNIKLFCTDRDGTKALRNNEKEAFAGELHSFIIRIN